MNGSCVPLQRVCHVDEYSRTNCDERVGAQPRITLSNLPF